ncbi:hypothetical protein GBBBJNDB_00389 [Pseudomonas phage Callisto]|nr:hypothetical protein GBBBJNDB_00389 [Pseudomonas phage Callisto]
MDNKKDNSNNKKPDEDVLGHALDHVKIVDLKTNKELLNKRG